MLYSVCVGRVTERWFVLGLIRVAWGFLRFLWEICVRALSLRVWCCNVLHELLFYCSISGFDGLGNKVHRLGMPLSCVQSVCLCLVLILINM